MEETINGKSTDQRSIFTRQFNNNNELYIRIVQTDDIFEISNMITTFRLSLSELKSILNKV